MSHITAADILARARDIIAAGPVPPPYHDEKDGDRIVRDTAGPSP